MLPALSFCFVNFVNSHFHILTFIRYRSIIIYRKEVNDMRKQKRRKKRERGLAAAKLKLITACVLLLRSIIEILDD